MPIESHLTLLSELDYLRQCHEASYKKQAVLRIDDKEVTIPAELRLMARCIIRKRVDDTLWKLRDLGYAIAVAGVPKYDGCWERMLADKYHFEENP